MYGSVNKFALLAIFFSGKCWFEYELEFSYKFGLFGV